MNVGTPPSGGTPPDLQVRLEREPGQPRPVGGGLGRADTITTGSAAHPLASRLTRLPAVRRLAGRPVPRSLIAAVAAVIGGVAVATYLDRPVETVTPEPTLVRPIITAETWLDASVEPVIDPVGTSDLPAEDWQQALAQHSSESAVVLPLSTQPRLFGLPPGQFHGRASCHARQTWPGGQLPQVTIWMNKAGWERHDGIPVTCDGRIHAVNPVADSLDYRPFEVVYFPHPPPGSDGHGESTPLDLIVVVSLLATR